SRGTDVRRGASVMQVLGRRASGWRRVRSAPQPNGRAKMDKRRGTNVGRRWTNAGDGGTEATRAAASAAIPPAFGARVLPAPGSRGSVRPLDLSRRPCSTTGDLPMSAPRRVPLLVSPLLALLVAAFAALVAAAASPPA